VENPVELQPRNNGEALALFPGLPVDFNNRTHRYQGRESVQDGGA